MPIQRSLCLRWMKANPLQDDRLRLKPKLVFEAGSRDNRKEFDASSSEFTQNSRGYFLCPGGANSAAQSAGGGTPAQRREFCS